MSLAFLHTGPVEEIRSDLNVISMTNVAPILLGDDGDKLVWGCKC